MFSELIDIDTNGNVFANDKRIALMPALFKVYKNKHMGSNMVKWIVSVCDNKSPYRRLPKDVRIEEVTQVYFGQSVYKPCSSKLVLEAIKEYDRLQYDPLVEDYKTLRDAAYDINKILREKEKDESNLDSILALQAKIGKSAEARDKIKKMIISDQKEGLNIQGVDEDDFSIFENDQRLSGG